MAVDGVNNAAGTLGLTESKTKNNSELSTEQFFKLIAAQLQNQDMNNPMSNSEMMSQMTQIAMMQAMDNFSTSMDDFAKVNTINYGTSMMGKEVLVATTGKKGELVNKTGTVNRVDIYNGVPTIYLEPPDNSTKTDTTTGTDTSVDTDAKTDSAASDEKTDSTTTGAEADGTSTDTKTDSATSDTK